jgi:hypothetical protein
MAETQISSNEYKQEPPNQGFRFPCQTYAKSPKSSDEPQIAQKSLQTIRKGRGKLKVH